MRSEPRRWVEDPEAHGPGQLLRELDRPPTSAARERVWARLSSPERAGFRAWPWLVAVPAMVAAIAILGPFGGAREPEVGAIAALTGETSLLDEDQRRRLAVQDLLFPRDRIETGIAGRVFLVGEGVEVIVEPESVVEVGTLAGGIAARLERGIVVVRAQKREPAALPVTVVAGDHRIEVVGTLFQVFRRGGRVGVKVREGRVRVHGPEGSTEIGPGEGFGNEPALGRLEISRPALAMLGEIAARKVERPVDNQGEATVRIAPDAALTPRPARGTMTGRTPAEAVAEGGFDAGAEPEPAARTASGAEPNVGAQTGSPTASDTGLSEAEALYQLAVETDDPEAAIALFDRVATFGEPWDEVAGYQAARRAARNNRPDAAQRFEALVARFPQGTFAMEARLTLIDLAMRQPRYGPARSQIDAFVSTYPDSERLPELHFLRAEILRTQDNECGAAVADYAVAQGSVARGDDATFWRGWCLTELGRRAEATRVFEDYAERYPEGAHIKAVRAALQ